MVIVIGATGFLGSHLLCHLIKSKEKIRAIYRTEASISKTETFLNYYNLPKDSFKNYVEWIKADVLDIETLLNAFEGATHIYNCSGFVSFNKQDKNQMIAVNATGTANIINACVESKCQKLIHVSSIAALGETKSEEPVTEETRWISDNTESWYSISKFNAEVEAWRGIAEGLSVVIVNPSVIIGPGDWNEGSPMLYKTVNKGLKYYTNGITGFVDVRDVCTAMIRLMESSIEGKQFIISGSNQSFQKLFTEIAASINKPSPTKYASSMLLSIAWRLESIRSLLSNSNAVITKNTAKTAQKKCFYSSQNLIDSLPSYSFTPFEETILFTGECYKKDFARS